MASSTSRPMSRCRATGRRTATALVAGSGRAGAGASSASREACSERSSAPGSTPSSSTNVARACVYAASASARRPLSRRATIRCAQSRSRSGCSASAISSSASAGSVAPVASSAPMWDSRSCSWSSSRRATAADAHGASAASPYGRPRHEASASVVRRSARSGAPWARRSAASTASRANRRESTWSVATTSRYPPASRTSVDDGSPELRPGSRTRRSRNTWESSVEVVRGEPLPHMASASASSPTGLPAWTRRGSPSSSTSNGPRSWIRRAAPPPSKVPFVPQRVRCQGTAPSRATCRRTSSQMSRPVPMTNPKLMIR